MKSDLAPGRSNKVETKRIDVKLVNGNGRKLCTVEGCMKIGDGKRSQYMCRKHYNISRQNDSTSQDDSSLNESDSYRQVESQETTGSWSDVKESICFYCDEPEKLEKLIVCTNPQCGRPWHIGCQKRLLLDIGKTAPTNVDPSSFICSECQALKELPDEQKKAFLGDDLFLD